MRFRIRSISSSYDFADPGLDRLQPDQFTVELVEHLADADSLNSRPDSAGSGGGGLPPLQSKGRK